MKKRETKNKLIKKASKITDLPCLFFQFFQSFNDILGRFSTYKSLPLSLLSLFINAFYLQKS